MRIKFLSILFLSFLCCQSGICQNRSRLSSTPSGNIDFGVSKTRLDIAKFQINDIKTRGLIVRLKTNKDRIAAYRKSGSIKVANKMEEEAQTTNLILMYAFLTEWSYCPVYFMESQNTQQLIQHDTLIAKTFDLKRDTAIYMAHDSFYLLDYGALMANEVVDNYNLKDTKKTEESSSTSSYDNLVVKNYAQNQLNTPMPYFAKVLLPGLTTTDNIEPISLPPGMNDTLSLYLAQYQSISELQKSPARAFVNRYLDAIYAHIRYVNNTSGKNNNETFSSVETDSYTTDATIAGAGGNPFQKAVRRLNKSYIEYYCKRLDKDRNILSRDDIQYWWQRNPNIRYFPYLHDLEVTLKAATMDTKKKATR